MFIRVTQRSSIRESAPAAAQASRGFDGNEVVDCAACGRNAMLPLGLPLLARPCMTLVLLDLARLK